MRMIGTRSRHRSSMYLSAEERGRAMDIKQAIEESKRVHNLTDFDYVHLALCCLPATSTATATRGHPAAAAAAAAAEAAAEAAMDDTETGSNSGYMDRVLDTAYKLQCFREQYHIQDTAQDGVATIRQLMEQQPGHLLDISYLPSEECYNCVADFARLNPSAVRTEADYRTYQGGFYYMMRAMATNVQTIRNGIVILVECEGMGFHNLNVGFQERCIAELWNYYPARHKESLWVNTPTAANLMYAMCKKLMTASFRDTWRVGGTLEGYEGRLDALFTMPTPEIAQASLLRKIECYLQERYYHEKTFSLHQPQSQQPSQTQFVFT